MSTSEAKWVKTHRMPRAIIGRLYDSDTSFSKLTPCIYYPSPIAAASATFSLYRAANTFMELANFAPTGSQLSSMFPMCPDLASGGPLTWSPIACATSGMPTATAYACAASQYRKYALFSSGTYSRAFLSFQNCTSACAS